MTADQIEQRIKLLIQEIRHNDEENLMMEEEIDQLYDELDRIGEE